MPASRTLAASAQVTITLLFLAGCADTTPVDRERLASVQTIFFGGIAEPNRAFLEPSGGPPRSLIARANVAPDARNAIGAVLAKEGYGFTADPKSADASLSISIRAAGYISDALFHRDCKPFMVIDLNLKDRTGATILNRGYTYMDGLPAEPGMIVLPANPKYTSPDCTGYSPELVMSAFREVVPLLAKAVGEELAKR